MKECDDKYDFDGSVAIDATCHRLEEGRPWRDATDLSSTTKENNSASDKGKKTSENKLTFETRRGSSKKETLPSSSKKKHRVIKYIETVNTSRWPGWRWVNFFHRTLAW